MLNTIGLVGRLTKDVDLRYTPNGFAVATFTIAVQRTFKNSGGEYDADFFRVEVWRKRAENLSLYCKKGSLVGVKGELRSRNYEVDGEKRIITYVLADNIAYLDSKEVEKPEEDISYSMNDYVADEEVPVEDSGFSDEELPY